MNLYEERLAQLTPILKTLAPERIYVYGSRIYGNSKTDSDIDVLVVVHPDADTIQLKRQLALSLYNARYPFDIEPDVHVVPRDIFDDRIAKGDPFLTNVIKGRLLYGSATH